MLTTMIKKDHGQPLVIHGHLRKCEIKHYQRLGYRIEKQELAAVQQNKNGIERR